MKRLEIEKKIKFAIMSGPLHEIEERVKVVASEIAECVELRFLNLIIKLILVKIFLFCSIAFFAWGFWD